MAYRDPNQVSECKYCGRKIRFEETIKGQSMPVEAKPVYYDPTPQGDAWVLSARGRMVRCVIHDAGDCVGSVPHWAKCTRKQQEAEEQRRQKKEQQDEFRRQREERRAKLEEKKLKKAGVTEGQCSFF
ncbi:hypothetical protein LJC56_10100 [Christensenellaceae bacterium OttesenSCG-928-K19]|nr:hypothetical protein [Christensenellaceae bacterium OttesenSCG-928-K19]